MLRRGPSRDQPEYRICPTLGDGRRVSTVRAKSNSSTPEAVCGSGWAGRRLCVWVCVRGFSFQSYRKPREKHNAHTHGDAPPHIISKKPCQRKIISLNYVITGGRQPTLIPSQIIFLYFLLHSDSFVGEIQARPIFGTNCARKESWNRASG